MENELSDEKIIELAVLNSISMRTGAGAIKLARAVIAADRALKETPTPYGWSVSGTGRVYFGEHAEQDAQQEAKQCGGACKAFALYAAPEAAKDEEIAALKSQKPELVYIDALGRGRYKLAECDDGVARFVMGGDKIYWPLSREDADRLHESCCGDGRFDGPNVAEIAALKAERDALQADAGRLDWLATNPVEALEVFGRMHPGEESFIRQDIDAARAKE